MATYDQKEELCDFLNKVDWEGGFMELLFHSGTRYWPEQLKEAGDRLYRAYLDAEKDIDIYVKDLGFADKDEAMDYMFEDDED